MKHLKKNNLLQYLRKNYTHHWAVLSVIFLAAIFFRFYNTPQRYGFDIDPVRDALVSIYGAETFQFPLTGPASGIAAFTFGPWYYYQLIAAELIFPFDYSQWIYLGIVSLLFIFVMYKIGAAIKDRTLGIILAAIAALSPSQVGPTAGLSNPNFIPFFAAITVYIFLLVLQGKRKLWIFFVWGLIFSIGINHHYQIAGLGVLFLIYFIHTIVTKKFNFYELLLTIIGTIVAFIPMIVFELRSGWYNSRGIIAFLTEGRGEQYIPNSWKIYLGDFWPGFWSYILGVPIWLGVVLLIAACVCSLVLAIKTKSELPIIYIAISFVINFIVLRYISVSREYYYFLYLHPFIFLGIGYLLYYLIKVKWGIIAGVVLVIVLLPFMLKEDWQRVLPQGLYTEYSTETDNLVHLYPKKSFMVYECNMHERNKVFAVVFLLQRNGKIDEQGQKIGFTDNEECRNQFMSERISDGDTYDLGRYSSEDLTQLGWKKVTPETVYTEVVLSH